MKEKCLFFVLVVAAVFLQSCIFTTSVPRPDFPKLSSVASPTEGLLEITGTNQAVLVFKDQAGREVMRWSEKGQSPVMRINDKYATRIYQFRLELGRYTIDAYPYFYQTFPRTRLVELLKVSTSVNVDRKRDTHHRKTGRYWGWVARISVGDKPYRGPRVDIRAKGITGIVLNKIFSGGE